PVAGREIAPDRRLPGADVDDVGIGRCDGDGADRPGREVLVRRRLPGQTAVGGLPDAAPRRPHVVDTRLVEHAGDGRHTPSPEWTHQTPGEREETAGFVTVGR